VWAMMFRIKWWVMRHTQPGLTSWGQDSYPVCGHGPPPPPGTGPPTPHTWQPAPDTTGPLHEWTCVRCGAVSVKISNDATDPQPRLGGG